MQSLRPFFMENWLETWRLSARYNLGESGHRSRTVRELLCGAGLSEAGAAFKFLDTPLYDSPHRGREDLRAAIAALHNGAHADDVLVTTGTSEALFLLFRALAPKKVALLLPAFQLLYEIPERMGAEIVGLPIRWNASGVPSANWTLWFKILAEQAPDVCVFNHPHNPSGLTFTEAELDTLNQFCSEHGIFLVADEHYRFLGSQAHPLGPGLFTPSHTMAVTGSFIKCTGTPGLRIGWCLAPREILTAMQNEKNYTTHTVNPISEWIALDSLVALVDENSALFCSLRNEWTANRLALEGFLRKGNNVWRGAVPEGGLVCALSHASWESDEVFAKARADMERCGLFLLPLESMEFAESYARMGIAAANALERGNGVRLGLGCEPKLFAEALSVLHSLMCRL
jgi:N-succinyldiaminopimelate aminotransferase